MGIIAQQLQDVKRKYGEMHKQSLELSEIYGKLFEEAETAADMDLWEKKRDAVKYCGTVLEFAMLKNADGQTKQKLVGANFCRCLLCPTCQQRRAVKLYAAMLQIWNAIFAQYREIEFDAWNHRKRPRLRALLLTLTVPNCHGNDLRKTIDAMAIGWHNLQRFPVFKAIKGYYRTLEVTYNAKTDSYHPHYHVLCLVDEDYFHDAYVTHEKWLEIWRRCMRDDSICAVDVRALRGSTPKTMLKNLNEVCKYTVKPCDFLSGNLRRDMSVVSVLDHQLKGVRRASFGGWLKQMRAALKLEDAENQIDSDFVPDGFEKIGTVWLHWANGIGEYEMN